jgi:hypothetical protein
LAANWSEDVAEASGRGRLVCLVQELRLAPEHARTGDVAAGYYLKPARFGKQVHPGVVVQMPGAAHALQFEVLGLASFPLAVFLCEDRPVDLDLAQTLLTVVLD